MPVSGSTAPPCQFDPPVERGIVSVPLSPPFDPYTIGGVKSGPSLYCEAILTASAFNSGVKSIRVSSVTPCQSYPAGLVGNGCVFEVFSPGTSDCGTGRSTNGQTGSPVVR